MDDKKFIAEALENYKTSVDGWSEIYNDALDDLKFVFNVGGGQWSDTAKRERGANRTTLVLNKLLKFVRQLRGDIRDSKPTIRTVPVDNEADPLVAEIYNGIIRYIDYTSNANIAYETAYLHAISGGIGFFRIVTEYENLSSFNQDIKVKRILNPFAVLYDPSASEFNYEDARWCFIEDILPKKVFEKLYPDAELSNFNSDGKGQQHTKWFEKDTVRIAEYFWKDVVQKKIAQLDDGSIVEPDDRIKEFLTLSGQRIIRERTIDDYKVKWCKMSGTEIIESAVDWAGKYIPIIPVSGDEIVVDGKKYLFSLIRGAKDIQAMYNFWCSAATEKVALEPKTPFIIDARQIEGYENEWNTANTSNKPYIRYRSIAGIGKPQREPSSPLPASIMNMMQQTQFDLEDHLGKYAATKGSPSNDRSNLMLETRISQSEKGNITFVDNFARALIYTGKQLIDLIPKIYDGQRIIPVIGEDGKMFPASINKATPDGIINDLTVGKFDLVATVSQSYSTKRMEAVDMMTKVMQYAPTVAPIIAPYIFKYSDFEGAREIFAEITEKMNAPIVEGGGNSNIPVDVM